MDPELSYYLQTWVDIDNLKVIKLISEPTVGVQQYLKAAKHLTMMIINGSDDNPYKGRHHVLRSYCLLQIVIIEPAISPAAREKFESLALRDAEIAIKIADTKMLATLQLAIIHRHLQDYTKAEEFLHKVDCYKSEVDDKTLSKMAITKATREVAVLQTIREKEAMKSRSNRKLTTENFMSAFQSIFDFLELMQSKLSNTKGIFDIHSAKVLSKYENRKIQVTNIFGLRGLYVNFNADLQQDYEIKRIFRKYQYIDISFRESHAYLYFDNADAPSRLIEDLLDTEVPGTNGSKYLFQLIPDFSQHKEYHSISLNKYRQKVKDLHFCPDWRLGWPCAKTCTLLHPEECFRIEKRPNPSKADKPPYKGKPTAEKNEKFYTTFSIRKRSEEGKNDKSKNNTEASCCVGHGDTDEFNLEDILKSDSEDN